MSDCRQRPEGAVNAKYQSIHGVAPSLTFHGQSLSSLFTTSMWLTCFAGQLKLFKLVPYPFVGVTLSHPSLLTQPRFTRWTPRIPYREKRSTASLVRCHRTQK
ncbi:hypothetical protein LJ739_11225 [Aestuariibacter halophilus]|uniref:Uncharacterized protein n=1 Tax=Fluctibacter halophilus TaxID=226011 RepID=A0ABS8G8G8_9ALTE|nr:hypothetical protein [Aestuariibacter halophilus]MCC2616813.1 hypothetical protein [Aestuariibacter halophilus]